MKKILYIVGGIILVIVFVVIVTGDSKIEDPAVDHTGEEVLEDETKVDVSENSRTNPAKINETLVVKRDTLFDKVTYEIELIETISGDKAWSMIRDANRFNDEPEEGKEYILAKFRIKVLETEEDKPHSVNNAQFDAVSKDGVVYSEFISVSGLSPSISTDLYEGGEHIGYTYFLVEKEDFPVAVVHRNEKGAVWFDLRSE